MLTTNGVTDKELMVMNEGAVWLGLATAQYHESDVGDADSVATLLDITHYFAGRPRQVLRSIPQNSRCQDTFESRDTRSRTGCIAQRMDRNCMPDRAIPPGMASRS